MTDRTVWVPPVCGLIASVPVGLIARATNFEYGMEAAMAAFFFVASMVSDHQKGLLKSNPVIAIALSIAMAAFGVVVIRWIGTT